MDLVETFDPWRVYFALGLASWERPQDPEPGVPPPGVPPPGAPLPG